jgi:hypothetical protein
MYAKDRTTIVDRREMLRVKVKSLAEEARIIRREESRSFGELRDELHRHRAQYLRAIARDTHIAYGFIKGRTLEQMEAKSEKSPNWDAVRKMIKKYGPRDFVEPECMRPAVVAAPMLKAA